jgi:membrane fusion protein (multidrug efflux system)
VRALFDNTQRVLLPGMYVRAKIEEGINEQAYVVPQQGVTHDQKGDPTALVVGADGKVATRQLVTSGTYGANWVVESGLQTGDRVIVQGVDKVRPGMTVKTVDAQLPGTDSAAQTAAAAPASDAHSAQ